MYIRNILLLILLPILMSLVSNTPQQNTLEVKVEVVEKNGGADVIVEVQNGNGPYNMMIFNNKVKLDRWDQDKSVIFSLVTEGKYSLIIQDKSGNQYVGSVIVD